MDRLGVHALSWTSVDGRSMHTRTRAGHSTEGLPPAAASAQVRFGRFPWTNRTWGGQTLMSCPTSDGPEPALTLNDAAGPAGATAAEERAGLLPRLIRIAKLPMLPIRRLYDWTIRWARTRHAPYALFIVSFAESSVFPVPPDALLIPMVLSRPKAWIRIAGVCTIGSVCGALLGYAIGWWFYESVGRQIVDAYNLHDAMATIEDSYSRHAFPTVLTAAFTPIPYKVITIGAGLYKVSLPAVIIASLIGRASRFFLVAGLLRLFGERIAMFVERYFDALALAFAALLIGGFLAIKYLF